MNGYITQPVTQNEQDVFFEKRLNRGSEIIFENQNEISGFMSTEEMDTSLMNFDPYSEDEY